MRAVRSLTLGLVGVAVFSSACIPSYRQCADPADAGRLPEATKLSQTGLFTSVSPEVLAPGVKTYEPRFQLWSDGAEKRRWYFLPAGAQIDASDRDAWQFPVGTKFWKEFTRDGVKVETRLLERTDSGWRAVAYVWNGDDADAQPAGQVDAGMTAHDVPAAKDCVGCHGGTPSFVLGFSGVQLPVSSADGGTSIDSLTASGAFSTNLGPIPSLPGDETTQRALGWLHANCAHCHNQHRPPPGALRCWDPKREFDLSLRLDSLGSLAETPVMKTAKAEELSPGKPEASAIFTRTRGDLAAFQQRMPPLATEVIDPDALPLLDAWIKSLPAK